MSCDRYLNLLLRKYSLNFGTQSSDTRISVLKFVYSQMTPLYVYLHKQQFVQWCVFNYTGWPDQNRKLVSHEQVTNQLEENEPHVVWKKRNQYHFTSKISFFVINIISLWTLSISLLKLLGIKLEFDLSIHIHVWKVGKNFNSIKFQYL